MQNDTRRWSTGRLWSGEGYAKAPTVDDCLLFTLPMFQRYSGRDVEVDGCRWELWSPNSAVRPYFPGVRHSAFDVVPAAEPRLRRFDGHLGRFDYCRCPQYYDSKRPWLGFIRRPESVTVNEREEFAEWWEIGQHWESDPSPATTTGRVDVQLMLKLTARGFALQDLMGKFKDMRGKEGHWWTERPVYPTIEEINGLSSVREFDEALDLCKALQRGLKEQLAWVDMASTESEARPYPISALRRRTVGPAIDRWMGVWLNGVGETRGLWLLTVGRVPCFIIHEYLPGVDYPVSGTPAPDHRSQRLERSFLMGTPMVDAFKPEANLYERLRREKGSNSIEFPKTDILGFGIGSSRFMLPSDRAKSSSWAQGYSRPVAGSSAPSTMVTPITPLSPAQPSTSSFSKVQDVKVSEERRPLPVIEEVFVDRGMPLWERPPAIMGLQGSGKWSNWWEEKIDGKPCFVRKGVPRQGGSRRFDRQARRILHFVQSPELRTSEFGGARFGRRAPDWEFYVVDGVGRRFVKAKSWWMYRTQTPDFKSVGEVAIIPTQEEMQLGMSMAGIKRTDGYVTEDEEEEDWEPTYMDNQSYDPTAMDVDVPEPPAPTRDPTPENRDKFIPRDVSVKREVFIRRSRSRSLDDGIVSRRGEYSRSRSRSRGASLRGSSRHKRRHSESSDSPSRRRFYGRTKRLSRSRSRGYDVGARSREAVSPPRVLITEFLRLGELPESVTFEALKTYVRWVMEEARIPLEVIRVLHLVDGGSVWWYMRLDDRRSALVLRGFLVDNRLGPGWTMSCDMVDGDDFASAEERAEVVYRNGFGPAVRPDLPSDKGSSRRHRSRSRSHSRDSCSPRGREQRSPNPRGRKRTSHRDNSSGRHQGRSGMSRRSRRSASPLHAAGPAPRRLADRLHSPSPRIDIKQPSPLIHRMELGARVSIDDPAPVASTSSNRHMAPTSPEPREKGRRGRRSGWKNQPGLGFSYPQISYPSNSSGT